MERYFNYNIARYRFVALISDLFGHDLQLLHELLATEY